MKHNSKIPENIYAKRRAQILAQIKGEAALFCALPEKGRERDMYYEFQQDANLYYLTGIEEPQTALLMLGSNTKPRSILFLREKDPYKEQWQGVRLGLKIAKAQIKVDLVLDIASLKTELPKFLAPYPCLHYTPGVDVKLDQFILSLAQTLNAPRCNFPSAFVDARLLTAPLRWVKDKEEIKRLKQAAAITAISFYEVGINLRNFATELHCAKALEEKFYKYGATRLAFPSIVAAADHATYLHHVPQKTPLKSGGLVLIDAGANVNGYCADVTRTFPLSGKFSKPQAQIYQAVYRALQTGIKKARPGVTMSMIHQAVVKDICASLAVLKIIKSSAAKIEKDKSYQRYFMHRAGHWLGLEAHDISPIVTSFPQVHGYDLKLVPGNVLTMEPGLYFDPGDKSVPQEYRGLGIRLEEDILITKAGRDVLTDCIPIKLTDIENICTGRLL
ncbi:MAG: aminopeptidase P N-terminal domain-containing protein [Deltaproteobacteria bacterium]|nr:aminopeptidase P N-terminal domain-containing protein [Deltaproteobacteria bacterium]